jgi:hypothetical protein
MAKFRKKPVVIEAWLWTGETATSEPQPIWLHTSLLASFPGNGTVAIRTLEGTMIASPGDWIIRGVKGEIYPCKPDIFAATYEAVE